MSRHELHRAAKEGNLARVNELLGRSSGKPDINQPDHNIVAILARLARDQGPAIVLVTHDARILDIADRVLTLADGAISN